MKHDVKSIKPLKDLNLTDRFLFDMVMEDLQTQQDALSIIFGRDIPLLSRGETEKEFRVSPSVRSIRMDVFSIDEEKAVYNTEMQQKQQFDLAKRAKAANLDAIHDTVHEMAKDEARHGKGFEGLYNRYFKK